MTELLGRRVEVLWRGNAAVCGPRPQYALQRRFHKVLNVDNNFIKLVEVTVASEPVSKPFYIPLAVIARIDEVDDNDQPIP